jgi:hypothetical protein
LRGQNKTADVPAMVDSGATALFINQKYVKEKRIYMFPLHTPMKVYNIDRTLNHGWTSSSLT